MKANKLLFVVMGALLLSSCRSLTLNSANNDTPITWSEISEAEFVEFANSKDYSDIHSYSLSLVMKSRVQANVLNLTRNLTLKFDLDSTNAYYGRANLVEGSLNGLAVSMNMDQYDEIAKDSSGNYIETTSDGSTTQTSTSSYEAIQSKALDRSNAWSAAYFYKNIGEIIEKYYVGDNGSYKIILPTQVEEYVPIYLGNTYIFDSTGLMIDIEGTFTMPYGSTYTFYSEVTTSINQPIDHISILPSRL